MAIKPPMQGRGQFQWNGGWFGGQIGGTAWMLPTGLILIYKAPLLGIIWLSIFVAINSLGFWMWNRRDSLDPYRSIQMLFIACGVGGLIAVFSLDFLRPDTGLFDISFRGGHITLENSHHRSLRQIYLFLMIGVPAMMGWFALMERGARKARATPDPSQVVQSQPGTNP